MEEGSNRVELSEHDRIELDVLRQIVLCLRGELSRLDDDRRERVWGFVTDKFDKEIYPQIYMDRN